LKDVFFGGERGVQNECLAYFVFAVQSSGEASESLQLGVLLNVELMLTINIPYRTVFVSLLQA
jgi:hypothetical protein